MAGPNGPAMGKQGVIVAFEGVTKQYGDVRAVDSVDLDIREGEFFALLGPSGCGKTTLMRMLAGFEEPSEGRILLDGEDVAGLPPHRRPVNMMFQSYALFPHMTVERNIAFGLRQDGIPREEISRRVDHVLSLVQLEGFRSRKPHQLSGGQRQRAALARSVVKEPRVLLLDEPLGALDKKLRQETQIELVNIQESLGITFMVVTHDQEEAMTVADRIAVMDHGLIVQVATPAEIYEAPNSRYVAEFIGEANLLEGRLVRLEETGGAESVAVVDWKGMEIRCLCAAPDIRPGTEVCVSLRPEKVRLSTRPDRPDGPNALRGTVEDILYVGNLSTYHLLADSGSKLVAQIANDRRLVERRVTWEDQVWVHWGEDAGVLLTC